MRSQVALPQPASPASSPSREKSAFPIDIPFTTSLLFSDPRRPRQTPLPVLFAASLSLPGAFSHQCHLDRFSTPVRLLLLLQIRRRCQTWGTDRLISVLFALIELEKMSHSCHEFQ